MELTDAEFTFTGVVESTVEKAVARRIELFVILG